MTGNEVSQTSMWLEFAKAGGPSVVTLVVVGYLIWKATSPLAMRLIQAISDLASDVRSMTKEISGVTAELRLMAHRMDILEREVRLGSGSAGGEHPKATPPIP